MDVYVQVVDLERDPRERRRDKGAKQGRKKVDRKADIESATIILHLLGYSEEITVTQETEVGSKCQLASVPHVPTLPEMLWGR